MRTMERRAFEVRGIVQGVGFRPFVHRLASRLRLAGFVANNAAGVEIEIEGCPDAIERFERELTTSAPPLARIEAIGGRRIAVRGDRLFRIERSRADFGASVFICPDVATCDACLRELFDPRDRRYGYPFINCTACGPRLTIVTGTPYDRERTTMARFAMCAACRAEYLDPADRRFHAEPIACPACGPTLAAFDVAGTRVGGDPVERAAQSLRCGLIVAIKGLGGFHLACDASDKRAVAALRRRKQRDDKPFAVMVRDLAAAQSVCDVTAAETSLLTSAARPIVLVRRRPSSIDLIADAVAPDTQWLGIMLPYTPLHHLVMTAVDGRPLVMTSGNRSDEPIAVENEDAVARLSDIADLFVVHDRAIHVRCDDSVVRHPGAAPIVVRRSRGFAPAPIALPFRCPEPILAVGGQLKNTFALGRDDQAFLSHHVGDLDDLLARDAFDRDLALYEQMLKVSPRIVAHDLHPDYASTRVALSRHDATRIAVQHHHAHVAACLAEHGARGPVLGVAWDGAGWGTDGCVWGGEFLAGDCAEVVRAAHFRYVAMPGGDRAAREPWRMALAHLADAAVDEAPFMPDTIAASTRAIVTQMIERRINAPMTSSVGRLFDAVAAICGAPAVTTYEGQAAMWLESLAERTDDDGDEGYPFAIEDGSPSIVDTRPLIRSAAADRLGGVPRAAIARRFHRSLAEIIAAVCRRVRVTRGLTRVALTGGVFANALLTCEAEQRLRAERFEVYRHRLVPPGDGGLSLGQLAVAAAQCGREN